MVARKNFKRVLIWLVLCLLMASLVCAVGNELLKANQNAADAGSSGVDMEIASLDTIKQSKSKPVNYSQQTQLRRKIDAADKEYQKLAAKAKAESSATGDVTAATRNAGMACAQKYMAACDNLSSFWEKGGSHTRARLIHEAGLARKMNADMVFNAVDSSKVSAYNSQMDKLAKARKEYLSDKDDIADADRAAIKSSLTPRLEKMKGSLGTLLTSVMSLLDDVKSKAGSGMSVGSIGGCAKQAVTGGGNPLEGGLQALLSPLMSLVDLVKSMISNVTGMMSDISSL